jgi:transcriptional regulator with XRE-family HTH domain
MTSLTNKQKRDWARLLYIKENLTQAEIAERVGASKVSVNKWAKSGNWELEKASLTVTRQEQLSRLYQQIAEINRAISNREEGKRYANSKEADAINKIAAAIDKLERETNLSDIISVSIAFLNWLRKHDLTKAQELSACFDLYIKDCIK